MSMKILRVRRGFSTNCSGANEYFPPNQNLAPPTADTPDGGPWSPTPSTQVVFRWVTFMPDGAPPPLLREAMAASDDNNSADGGSSDAGADGAAIIPSADAGVASSTDNGADAEADVSAPESSLRGTGSVGLILFVLMVAAVAVFGLKRLSRNWWRSLRRGRDDR